jgi:integrase/recombinase XerD
MNRELERYSAYLVKQKQQEEATVTAYFRDLRAFRDYLIRARSEYQSWRDVTSDDAMTYCMILLDSGKHIATVNHVITSIRMFYDYLIIRGECDKNPFREVIHLKISREAPLVLTPEEAFRLVGAPMREYEVLIETLAGQHPRKYAEYKFVRDQLILELLYYCGMKISELLSLHDLDVNTTAMTISIEGKPGRNKSRVLTVPECVIMTYENYIQQRNNRWPSPAWKRNPVLLRNYSGGLITARSVNREITHYAQKSGLHPGISAGTLRATFAVRTLRSGADMQTFQFLLGFEDLSSADLYASRFKSLLTNHQQTITTHAIFHPKSSV